MALHIVNTDNVDDDGTLSLDEASFATTAVVGGTTYLFVTGYADNGVSVFAVAPDGTLTNVHNNDFDDDGFPRLGGASGVTTAVLGSATYLFVACYLGNGVLVLSVAADGTLTQAANVGDNATLELSGAFGVTTAVVAGTTYLFVTGAEDDGISVFRVAADGTLTNVHNVTDGPTLALDRPMEATTAVVGGVTYLFVAAQLDDGVSVFRVAANGALTHVANSDPALALGDPVYLATAVIDGTTYLFVAGPTGDVVNILRVEPGGALTRVAGISNGAAFEINAPHGVTTATIGGTAYLLVAEPSEAPDGRVSVFAVAADGTPTHVRTLFDDSTLELEGAMGVTTAVVGATAYLFVAGSTADGVSVFSLIDENVASPGDVLWRHLDDTVATASRDLFIVNHEYHIRGTGDFDGDGDSDILFRHEDGAVATIQMEGGVFAGQYQYGRVGTTWEIAGTGDFDADGDADVLWRHRDGAVVTWEMEDGQYLVNHNIAFASVGWEIDGLGDFDADGDADIIWRHRDGAVVTWEMEDGQYVVNHNIAFGSTSWQIEGTGDFDGDGDDDILWRHQDGAVVTWEMQGGAFVTNHNLPIVATSWQIAGAEDFDSDGDADILWRHRDGDVVTWEMESGAFVTNHNYGVVSNAWQIQGTGEFDLV